MKPSTKPWWEFNSHYKIRRRLQNIKKTNRGIFEIYFNLILTIECGFEAPNDKKEKPLERRKRVDEQTKLFKGNNKTLEILIFVLPNDILNKVGDYTCAKMEKIILLYENRVLELEAQILGKIEDKEETKKFKV